MTLGDKVVERTRELESLCRRLTYSQRPDQLH